MEPNIQPIISAGEVAESQPKILVVDDEENVRHSLTELLEIKNFCVTATASAEHALKLLEQTAFDLVLSDLLMPRIDGIALAKAIKEMGLNVPVVVMTGYASIETAVESMKAGASDFITKPFNMDQIIQVNRQGTAREIEFIAPEQVKERLDKGGWRILDVRTSDEYRAVRAMPSVNVPMDSLASQLSQLTGDKKWIVSCRSGGRATAACGTASRSGPTSRGPPAWMS